MGRGDVNIEDIGGEGGFEVMDGANEDYDFNECNEVKNTNEVR